jgi:hypothetical protein
VSSEGIKRKLSAILSSDVEGYSRPVGGDDVLTVRTLTAYRESTPSERACRAAKLCARAVPRLWLPRNRMPQLGTCGTVGARLGNRWAYPESAPISLRLLASQPRAYIRKTRAREMAWRTADRTRLGQLREEEERPSPEASTWTDPESR